MCPLPRTPSFPVSTSGSPLGFPGGQTVKSLPTVRDTWLRSLGREDPLEKGMATHSSTLAWKIPWTGSLVGYSPWGWQRVGSTE